MAKGRRLHDVGEDLLLESWAKRRSHRVTLMMKMKNCEFRVMFATATPIVCLNLLLCSIVLAQTQRPWTLLPETEAENIKRLCSRPGPPEFQGTWKPAESDIQMMESRLSRISRLRTRSGIIGKQIQHPERYYRQYLGIIIKNRKFIYINALCDDKPHDSWRETLKDVCDGACGWGVVYDIATGKFSLLEMNGVA